MSAPELTHDLYYARQRIQIRYDDLVPNRTFADVVELEKLLVSACEDARDRIVRNPECFRSQNDGIYEFEKVFDIRITSGACIYKVLQLFDSVSFSVTMVWRGSIEVYALRVKYDKNAIKDGESKDAVKGK